MHNRSILKLTLQRVKYIFGWFETDKQQKDYQKKIARVFQLFKYSRDGRKMKRNVGREHIQKTTHTKL